jgi:hypothetical protein
VRERAMRTSYSPSGGFYNEDKREKTHTCGAKFKGERYLNPFVELTTGTQLYDLSSEVVVAFVFPHVGAK